MACNSTGVNDARLNQFSKIKILDNFANQFGMFAVQNGAEKFMDFMDMNCGAIPEGDFEQVVDLNSPHQFLSLYMGVAESRFAFAVTGLVKMNEKILPSLCDALFQAGQSLNIEKCETAEQAFEAMTTYVLDGMPCDDTKQISKQTETSVEWEKLQDTHEAAWKKAGGRLEVYYQLQEAFVNGIIGASGFIYKVTDLNRFSIARV